VGNQNEDHLAYSRDLMVQLPQEIRRELLDIMGATSLICAMLLAAEPQKRDRQIGRLAKAAAPAFIEHIVALAPACRELEAAFYVPIIELAMPTLRRMSPAQYARFREQIRILVEADGRLTVYEFAVGKMITHHLGGYYSRTRRKETRANLDALMPHVVQLLAMLAEAGQRDPSKQREAFDAGMAGLKTSVPPSLLPMPESVALRKLDSALNNIVLGIPPVKKAIFEACCITVLQDHRVSVSEAELLRLTGSILDIPVPPFLEPKPDT